MATVAVSVKGQVALPAEVRRRLSISPGSRVEIDLSPDGTAATIRPAKRGKPSSVDEGKGMVQNKVGHVSREAMDGVRIPEKHGGKHPL